MRNSPGRCVSTNSGEPILAVADQIRKARDGQLQFFRIGRAGKKQSALRDAGRRRIGRQRNFENRRAGGSACNCRRSNFRSILESRMGTGQGQNFFIGFGDGLCRGLRERNFRFLRIVFAVAVSIGLEREGIS